MESSYISEAKVNKYGTIPNATVFIDFFGHWFANSGDTSNMIQLIAACKLWSGDGGASEVSGNKSVVFEQEILDNAGITNKSTARDEIAVHEIGHQFVESGNHVDSLVQEVQNHANTDYCIMTYVNNKENGVVEFCKDHLYEIRDASDPS